MILQFIKNITFTRLVKAADRLREFNFRKLSSDSDPLIHIDVPDDRGNRIVFRMQKENNNEWKIVNDNLPAWVSATEKELNAHIVDELG